MGGFHIMTAPVSQREYENLMKKNPSLVKNPARPVNNVSIIDAMIYCNQMSIRDGLEPAYVIEYEAKNRSWSTGLKYHDYNSVTIDSFASGYRLATTEEWRYARAQVEGMGVQAEYVYDGNFVQAVNNVEIVRITGAYDRTRAYDAARTMVADKESNVGPAVWLDLGPALWLDDGSIEYKTAMKVLGSYQEVLSKTESGVNTVRVTPVIRVMRPIFDYWKYTSGQ
jgi:hypothetical protein